MRRVGYWLSEKKKKKLDFEEHREFFRNAGIDLIQIDLAQPTESQGPFDLLIHKVTDLYALAVDGHEFSENAIKNLEGYIHNHPECLVLDPLASIHCLLNRYTQYQRVSKCEAMKDHRCMIPPFVELDSTNTSDNKEKLARAGVTFPLVCKPILAHGSAYAHQMSIIFNEESLGDIDVPCVAQSFINHNAILYKILVIGCKQFIIQRPSLKNLFPGNYPTIFFDTQEVSKADSDHPLNAIDNASLDEAIKPDWIYLDQLGHSLRETVELDLFGFDVIIDSRTSQYGIIDINFFPGFEAIDSFFGVLLDHIVKVLDASDRGQLMNGRLVAPPHDPANVIILNQLNLQSRRLKENDATSKGWPPSQVAPSSIIGLSPSCIGGSVSGDKSSSMYIGENNNVISLGADQSRDELGPSHILDSNSRSSSSSSHQRTPIFGRGQPQYSSNQPAS